MMHWIKIGKIYQPSRSQYWTSSGAALLPFFASIGDFSRVYFCGRDYLGRSRIGFFEININNPKKILSACTSPLVDLGPLGSFDDSGVTMSWIVTNDEKQFLFYTGWHLGVTVPFYIFIGLATSEDGGMSFQKVSNSPILGRNDVDPYLTATPCVLIEEGIWKMWYVSGVNWELENNIPKHRYHIKYAESTDGINWIRDGIVCIDFQSGDEYAIARPSVVIDDGLYKMWYSFRGDKYRIGYAESNDGQNWIRKDDEVGISVSDSGWDSEMIEYTHVFDHNDDRYMLYNGNGYGSTGIGLAKLKVEEN